MTVVDFPNPFVLREHRRCRVCGDLVLVFCCGGAECPRQGVYACSDHNSTPEATSERVLALALPQQPLDAEADRG